MPSDLEIPLDRVTYRDGQRLTAQDLRDDARHAFRRHALHTRYLHETWGVALGFKVTLAENGSFVGVGPGHAIDELGRDILLATSVKVPLPAVGNTKLFALTVHYQDDSAFHNRRDLAAVCLSGGLKPQNERPVFSWRRPGEVQFGVEVPLASVEVTDGGITQEPDLRVRRTTRPFVRPHVGCGETEAGRTGWEPHLSADNSSSHGIGVTVDTSAAGFADTPLYFAQLLGDFSSSDLEGFGCFGRHAALPVGGFAYISQTSQTDFTLRVGPLVDVDASKADQWQWRVAWIGLEPITGCEPWFDPLLTSTIVGYLRSRMVQVF